MGVSLLPRKRSSNSLNGVNETITKATAINLNTIGWIFTQILQATYSGYLITFALKLGGETQRLPESSKALRLDIEVIDYFTRV